MGLKSGRTNTIAVIIPSVQNSFFARALSGIVSVISKTNYSTIVCLTKESHSKEVDNFDMLSNGVVDGFIVAVSEETQTLNEFSHFEDAINDGKKLVMFDRVIETIPCVKVETNDYSAISEATKNLISSNRKNIILLSAINNLNVGKQRTKGYQKAMNEAGLSPVVLESNRDNIENLTGGGRTDDLFGSSDDLSRSTFDNEDVNDEKNENIGEYNNKIKWDFRFAHSLTYLNNRGQKRIGNNSLMFSGNIMLSKKWKVGGSSGYDFKNKGFTYTQLRFERDLDSWKMNFSWVPFSNRQSWYFFIGIKSGFLSDLKYDKRREPDKRL